MYAIRSYYAHLQAPLGPNQGRGIATGFWFNFGGDMSVSLALLGIFPLAVKKIMGQVRARRNAKS